MSEQQPQPKGPEQASGSPEASREARENLKRIHEAAKAEKDPTASVDTLKANAEKHALSGKETTVGERQESSQTPVGLHKELKNNAYKQTLRHIQAKLHGTDKVLSKTIHKPKVEKLSDIGAQTIARPSGILGGGIAALVGSSLLLFAAKRYGFEYNYSVFFLLFIAGFLLGVIVEGLGKLLRHKKNV